MGNKVPMGSMVRRDVAVAVVLSDSETGQEILRHTSTREQASLDGASGMIQRTAELAIEALNNSGDVWECLEGPPVQLCPCPECDEDVRAGHGGSDLHGLCYACELAGCTDQAAYCGEAGEVMSGSQE